MQSSISVVIPCYNSSQTIEKCLRSVFSQTHKPSQIIVIDDCSSDDSFEKLNKLKQECDQQIEFNIFQMRKNSGPSSVRNFGISKATSFYLALLDSDDVWLENHLEVNFHLASSLGESFAIVHQPIEEKDINVNDMILKRAMKFVDFSLNYYLFIQKNCSTITLFTSLKDVEGILFPNQQKYAEDFRFFIKLFGKVRRRVYISHPRTAVVGKHAWASGSGLSSRRFSMLYGIVYTLISELTLSKYFPVLLLLLPWHLIKALRRELLFFVKKINAI